MKNQYIADIGDYGKYGLLFNLAEQGIKIGVNWYLTKNDESGFKPETRYLEDKRIAMRDYNPALYDLMKELNEQRDFRKLCIQMVEESGLFPNFSFYHEILNIDDLAPDEREAERTRWHKAAMEKLKDADLVFADPDNGLSKDIRIKEKGSQKYILPCEIKEYFKRGQNVVYYHHRPRKKREAWMADKTIMKDLDGARLLAVSAHRWINRAYIFVVHEDEYEFYRNAIDGFLNSKWGAPEKGKKLPFFTIEDIH